MAFILSTTLNLWLFLLRFYCAPPDWKSLSCCLFNLSSFNPLLCYCWGQLFLLLLKSAWSSVFNETPTICLAKEGWTSQLCTTVLKLLYSGFNSCITILRILDFKILLVESSLEISRQIDFTLLKYWLIVFSCWIIDNNSFLKVIVLYHFSLRKCCKGVSHLLRCIYISYIL